MKATVTIPEKSVILETNNIALDLSNKTAIVRCNKIDIDDPTNNNNWKEQINLVELAVDNSYSDEEKATVVKFLTDCVAKAFKMDVAQITEEVFSFEPKEETKPETPIE